MTARISRWWRKCREERQGNTATEFAMIAAPFFPLLGGIVEMAFLMLASNALQSAVQFSGQQLDNGAIAADATAFRNAICERLPSVMSCESSLVITAEAVERWENFESDNEIVETFPVDAESEDLFVRVAYQWPVVFPTAILGTDVNSDNGHYLLAATVVVR